MSVLVDYYLAYMGIAAVFMGARMREGLPVGEVALALVWPVLLVQGLARKRKMR